MLALDSMTALVIAPHPDDEVYGCGGLIRRLKAARGKVYVLYMTVGTTLDFSARGRSTQQERVEEIRQAAKLLDLDGYSIAFPGDEYHLKLDTIPQRDLVHAIERASDISLLGLRPNIVVTTSSTDYNQDHRAVSYATVAAVRPGAPQHRGFQPLVLTYELPYHQWDVADIHSAPNLYITLEPTCMDAKVAALEAYKSQLKCSMGPLSVHGVRTLASYRGLQCGSAAAEAFHVKRFVV